MAKYFIEYREEWREEIINHFGSVCACAKVCRIDRANLQNCVSGATGYISENTFLTVCRKMNLAPVCFTDHPAHSAFYNDHYKLSFDEYRQLCVSRSLSADCDTGVRYDSIDTVLKLVAGLTDDELKHMPTSTKMQISLKINADIDQILKDNLSGWTSFS